MIDCAASPRHGDRGDRWRPASCGITIYPLVGGNGRQPNWRLRRRTKYDGAEHHRRNEVDSTFAVEAEESAVLSGRPSGSHKIEGTGVGFIVPLWAETLADEIQTISTEEAMATARRLARHEGIFAGTSTGGNVAVALWVAKRLGPCQIVVTVAVDLGMKYLSTELYA